jgi:hypothetical protein
MRQPHGQVRSYTAGDGDSTENGADATHVWKRSLGGMTLKGVC